MKYVLCVVAGVMALGLVPAMAAEKAPTERVEQMEKIGALVGKLTLCFAQTLREQISNTKGEGGTPDHHTIRKLYDKAMAAPQNVVAYENSRPAEQRITSAVDEANAKMREINAMWTDFERNEWQEINAKMNQCHGIVGALNHILHNAVKQTLDQIVQSGLDLTPVVALLEALDKRADEVKAQAEAGHIALWRSVLAKWTEAAQ